MEKRCVEETEWENGIMFREHMKSELMVNLEKNVFVNVTIVWRHNIENKSMVDCFYSLLNT